MLVLLGIFLVCLIFWGVVQLNNSKNGNNKDSATRSEIQKLLDKNFDTSYPATEREVIKVYCRLQKQIYSDECTDEEMQGLFKQMRKMYDEELLAENPYNKHYDALVKEVKQYKEEKTKITNYEIIQDVGEVKKGTYEGKEQALVDVCFKTKEKNERQSFVQEFVLRKDESGRWKILGWYKVDAKTGEENE